jgi:RING finger protein 113A
MLSCWLHWCLALADNCKFLHDRGDYKTGWQLDKEWDEQQRARGLLLRKALVNVDRRRRRHHRRYCCSGQILNQLDAIDVRALEPKEDEEIDDLPFACYICREPFQDPVTTKYVSRP